MNRNNTFVPTRRRSNYGRNQNITPFASNIKLGPVSRTIMTAVAISALGLIYLTQATQVTGYDYASVEIDSKINELMAKKTDLEIEKARLTAIETISSSSVAKNMVTPSEIEYTRN